MNLISKGLKQILILIGIALFCVSCSKVPSLSENLWQTLDLHTKSNLQAIAFTGNPNHGWIVGSDSTILETLDGGNTWQEKKLELDAKYRLTSISFAGDEGWIAGEPSIVLHTKDEGKTWFQIPLSSKLPGSPSEIAALGADSAEMATTIGAIYRTEDGGKNWKSMVQEAVGVFRNLERSPDGKYVAVSAKGNFYSTWAPGDNQWQPLNRNSSRRVENMGFTSDGNLWMIARGGQLQFSDPQKPDEWQKPVYPEFSTSWGLLDLAYRTPNEIWVSGGSGNLLRSTDGGKTWEKDRSVEDIPSNFYKIEFFTPEKGFIIGQRGILLKYQGNKQLSVIREQGTNWERLSVDS